MSRSTEALTVAGVALASGYVGNKVFFATDYPGKYGWTIPGAVALAGLALVAMRKAPLAGAALAGAGGALAYRLAKEYADGRSREDVANADAAARGMSRITDDNGVSIEVPIGTVTPPPAPSLPPPATQAAGLHRMNRTFARAAGGR